MEETVEAVEAVRAVSCPAPRVVAERVRRSGGRLDPGAGNRRPRDVAQRPLDVRGLGGHRRGQELAERREGHAARARGELVDHLAAAPPLERLRLEPGAVAGQGHQEPRGPARARQRADGQRRRVGIDVRVARVVRDDVFDVFFGGVFRCLRLALAPPKRKRRRVLAFRRDGVRRAHGQREPHDVEPFVVLRIVDGFVSSSRRDERDKRHLREAEIGVAAEPRRVPRAVHGGGASEFLAVTHPDPVQNLVRQRDRAQGVHRLLANRAAHRRVREADAAPEAFREAEAEARARCRRAARGHRPEAVQGDVHRHRRGMQVLEARGRRAFRRLNADVFRAVRLEPRRSRLATRVRDEPRVPVRARGEKRVPRVHQRGDVLGRRLARRAAFRLRF